MSKIYFKSEVVKLVEKLLKDEYLLDAAKDIARINFAEEQIHKQVLYAVDKAQLLDDELTQKYPVINELFTFANILTANLTNSNGCLRNSVSRVSNKTPAENALSALSQDRFGIICHVALKKKIITEYSQFVDREKTINSFIQ